MLGIRYINETAVDIWVGSSNDFVTDIKSSSNLEDIGSCLRKCSSDKLRHLGIVVSKSLDKTLSDSYEEKILEIFNTIKQELPASSNYPQRITLILDRKEDYYIVQDIMFKTILKR